jgi:3-hydroxy-3-methylglutaryl CoA synthase
MTSRRLIALAQEMRAILAEGDPASQQIAAAEQLLGQLINQDVELTSGQAKLKEGVSRDQIVSVHDPEMRHWSKSSSKRFDGHKTAIGVDAKSKLITAVEVLPGNAADASPALSLTKASEHNTGLEAKEKVGNCAYGDGNTRQKFADAQWKLIAKVPKLVRKD